MQTAILTFIIPVISMIFTCAFLGLWWRDREQGPVLAFAMCFGLLAIGVAINIWLFGKSASAIGYVLYHIVSMAAMLCLLWGIAKRVEVKAPIQFCALTVPPVCAVIWLGAEYGQMDAMRIAQNTHSGVAFAIIAGCLWYGNKRSTAEVVLMWVIVAMASFAFIKPAWYGI